jgi:uncharacterized RDD family membrane protein YckC
MRGDGTWQASDAVRFEANGWYGLRRARLLVTPDQVVITHSRGREEIARNAIERVRCSPGPPLDKVSLWTEGRKVVFRLTDVAPFASWVRRSRLAPQIELDSDVITALQEFEDDERVQEGFQTGRAPSGGLLTANMAQRLFARLVDLVVVFALAFIVTLATASSDDAFIAWFFAMLLIYEIPLVAFCGWTVGKLWPSRIRVVAVKTGRPPRLVRATVRTLLVWPGLLLGRLRFMLSDRAAARIDGLHDRAAGTVVLSTTALTVLHEQSKADWPDLLADAQRRQFAGLADEEHELAADND